MVPHIGFLSVLVFSFCFVSSQPYPTQAFNALSSAHLQASLSLSPKNVYSNRLRRVSLLCLVTSPDSTEKPNSARSDWLFFCFSMTDTYAHSNCECAPKPAVCNAKSSCSFNGSCGCADGVCAASKAKAQCSKSSTCDCKGSECKAAVEAHQSCADKGSCNCAPGTCAKA